MTSTLPATPRRFQSAHLFADQVLDLIRDRCRVSPSEAEDDLQAALAEGALTAEVWHENRDLYRPVGWKDEWRKVDADWWRENSIHWGRGISRGGVPARWVRIARSEIDCIWPNPQTLTSADHHASELPRASTGGNRDHASSLENRCIAPFPAPSRRGRLPVKTKAVQKAIQDMLRDGKMTLAEVREWKEESGATALSCSRDTFRKGRAAALSEFVGVSNSDK